MKARFFFYKRNKLKTIDMSKISYYTAEGLKKLKDELNHLKDVERPKASNAIAEARDKGDLSENAEYDAILIGHQEQIHKEFHKKIRFLFL